MFQAVAGPFAGHFHQAERGHAGDMRLRMLTGQRALQRFHDLGAMRSVTHVYEIDDDDAAEIAQPELARNGYCRLEVGAEDRVLEIAMPDEPPGVDVDGGHRLGLVDDQVPAGLEADTALQRLADFVLDAVQIEDG